MGSCGVVTMIVRWPNTDLSNSSVILFVDFKENAFAIVINTVSSHVVVATKGPLNLFNRVAHAHAVVEFVVRTARLDQPDGIVIDLNLDVAIVQAISCRKIIQSETFVTPKDRPWPSQRLHHIVLAHTKSDVADSHTRYNGLLRSCLEYSDFLDRSAILVDVKLESLLSVNEISVVEIKVFAKGFFDGLLCIAHSQTIVECVGRTQHVYLSDLIVIDLTFHMAEVHVIPYRKIIQRVLLVP